MTHLAAACLLSVSLLQSAAAGPEAFRFHKEIERAGTADQEMISVTFDPDVYAATRDAMPDLRVLDGQGQQKPLLIERVVEDVEHVVRAPLGSRESSLRVQGDGLKVVVELEKEAQGADGLNIVTPLKDYERRVRVFGSKDGLNWMPLEENGLVFDYSRFMDIQNSEVRLPKNEYRRYAVEISGAVDVAESLFREMTRKYQGDKEMERVEKTVHQSRPFRMERLEFWKNRRQTSGQRDKKTGYSVAVSKVKEDLDERTTYIYIDARRQPITEFTLDTPSRNFSRPVKVQTPITRGNEIQWIDVAQGKASLIEFGAYRDKSLTVDLPEHRAGQYRIAILNEDNPPLKITGVKARGNVYRAVFIAEPDEIYRLVYGSATAPRPSYDAAAVLAPLRAKGHRPVEARLGPEVAAPAPPAPPVSLLAVLSNPLLLGAAIVVLVLLLGWALFRAARRIERLP